MGISDEALPVAEIEEFIEHAGEEEYVKEAFRKAILSIRKNGKSKVPMLLDELYVYASRIGKAKYQSLISAIFQIADDIYRDEDCERGGSLANTHLRIHWFIRKLTFERCNLEERSRIFLAACQEAQVGWLVNFTSSAITDIFPREGKEPEPTEKCLVSKEHISELKTIAISAIKLAANNGQLISHPQLPYILFRWEEFADDNGSGVRGWTNEQLKNDEDITMLARSFTGESWSHGMGIVSLGDRVSMRNVRAMVDGLERIIDVHEFRRRLEEIEKNDAVDSRTKENILIFLEAWRNQEKGDLAGLINNNP